MKIKSKEDLRSNGAGEIVNLVDAGAVSLDLAIEVLEERIKKRQELGKPQLRVVNACWAVLHAKKHGTTPQLEALVNAGDKAASYSTASDPARAAQELLTLHGQAWCDQLYAELVKLSVAAKMAAAVVNNATKENA